MTRNLRRRGGRYARWQARSATGSTPRGSATWPAKLSSLSRETSSTATRDIRASIETKSRGRSGVGRIPTTSKRAWIGAHVILTHRDPLEVLPSMTGLMATPRWRRSDAVSIEPVVETAVRGTQAVLDRVTRLRAAGRLSEERTIDVRYADLIRDPWPTMRTIYDRLGRELSPEVEARMCDDLVANPKDRSGIRIDSFAATNRDPNETRARFAGYMARYDVPEEV